MYSIFKEIFIWLLYFAFDFSSNNVILLPLSFNFTYERAHITPSPCNPNIFACSHVPSEYPAIIAMSPFE